MKVLVGKKITEANDEIARRNKKFFDEIGLTVVNLIGSPGAGKTALIEETLAFLSNKIKAAVVEGDLFTSRDAERLARRGTQVVQINTRGTCHLDAGMLEQSLSELRLDGLDILFVENVGNLVCPAQFDLGEHAKIVVLSVVEGSDKPEKYSIVFRKAKAVVITKADLLDRTDFDVREVEKHIAMLNEEAQLFITSARNGQGMGDWCRWLTDFVKKKGLTE